MERRRVVITMQGEIEGASLPDFLARLTALWEALPQVFAPDIAIRWRLVRLEERHGDNPD